MRRASGRYRETSLAYVGLTLMMSGFAGFVIAPALGIWFLLVASGCLAIGNGFTQPSISAYISRLADPARQGETLSGSQSLASLGRVFGPLVAGQLYTFSPRVPFAGCALINLLALFVGLGMRSVQPRSRSIAPGPVLES
jgi:DHA1 family tetracycline resistance protein-like MFS transporter